MGRPKKQPNGPVGEGNSYDNANGNDDYAAIRKKSLARVKALSAAGRDIGAIPEVVNPARKAECERDFEKFARIYFGQTFQLAWSEDHLTVIGQIEETVLRGGLFATAMPRGSGKTSLAETACIWAILYGHRSFVALIGSDEGHASQMLDSIKTELESNDLLQEDFPEAVYPIAQLEGISHRCKGQTYQRQRTKVEWSSDVVVIPSIEGSKSSGAIIKVAGITGGLRGMKFKRSDRRSVRPDLVIVDDPQTDQSARSLSQCETRERILAGAVLGLAGPGKKISGIMPCTVIRQGDMADRILDRTLHPEWHGTRTKMVYSFPTNEKLWEEYGRIRHESMRAGKDGSEATDFYRSNRESMDEGARVAWVARHNPDELSAIQHAMNLKLQDERAFHAEYQNEPIPEQDARTDDLTPDQVAGKLNRYERRRVPLPCTKLTAFIDVQASLLYYAVCAWEDDFTGSVIDYGAFPEQGMSYFLLRDAKKTLQTEIKAAGLEGQIYGGLEALTDSLLGRGWLRDDGAEMRIERLLIDANWGTSTDTIYQFCRQSKHAGIVMPSHGKYIGASSPPMREQGKKPGDKVGLNWKIPAIHGKRVVLHVIYDTNYWKSFIHTRFSVAIGDRGSLALWGSKSHEHRMFADQMCSEFRVRTSGRGREVDEWKLRPDRPDNHLFDCLVGSAVAGSIQGVVLPEAAFFDVKPTHKRVSFADLQRRNSEKQAFPKAVSAETNKGSEGSGNGIAKAKVEAQLPIKGRVSFAELQRQARGGQNG